MRLRQVGKPFYTASGALDCQNVIAIHLTSSESWVVNRLCHFALGKTTFFAAICVARKAIR
jgi:hypothetical protein